MKLNLIISFAFALLIMSISAAPRASEKRSTLGDNTEVFTDSKAGTELAEEEERPDDGDFDFDFLEHILK
ncbi:hypothetical protein BD408DRAFT_416230 [Parasitella parasitica]|nr:hypothetical protein BD408DRAFT_416230 [Parasitella parasitica]